MVLCMTYRLWKSLNDEFEETSTLLETGVEQLNEIAEVMVRLRSEHDKLSVQLMHENEKADLLFNILGSLLQEVRRGDGALTVPWPCQQQPRSRQ